ncbi:MAG: hypothetical protein ACLVL7_00990 [Anaerotruncus massiliensis (ex Togo et al. 2019)]
MDALIFAAPPARPILMTTRPPCWPRADRGRHRRQRRDDAVDVVVIGGPPSRP